MLVMMQVCSNLLWREQLSRSDAIPAAAPKMTVILKFPRNFANVRNVSACVL
jgi:hypothetical protein